MRERLDFSSISGIIRENMRIDGLSDEELFYSLFFHAFEQKKYHISIPDGSDVSHYLNGQRGITQAIYAVYAENGNIRYLKQGVSTVLHSVTDIDRVVEQLTLLLKNDRTISFLKRRKLNSYSKDSETFITECLMFGMSRKSIKRDSDGIRKKDFLLSDYVLDTRTPSAGSVFVGRDSELESIHERLQAEFCLFLEGIGGIGKSELAKQYVKKYKKHYENVLYLRYTGSLKQTIVNIHFVDDTPDKSEELLFEEHFRFFQLLDSSTLVILDNFDTVPEEETLFHQFIDMNFRLLCTTRSHIEEVSIQPVHEIQEMGYLLELFYAYAPHANKKESVVIDIIEEVYCHTLTVEMAAKTLTVSCLEPEELLSALRTEGVHLSNPNKIKVTKDSETTKKRLYRHIQTLFRLQELSRNNLDTLRYMALMPETGISRSIFHQWQHTQDYNSVNDLIHLGWIQRDSETDHISLHPLIHEVIKQFEAPNFQNCAKILQGIYTDCFCYGLDFPYYREILSTIESIYENITVDDADSSYLFMCSTMDYLDKYGNVSVTERILNIMEKHISTGNKHRKETAVYYNYSGGVALTKNDLKTALKLFQYGILYTEPVNMENAELASNLYSNFGAVSLKLGNVKDGKDYIKKAVNIREKYALPFNQNALIQEIYVSQIMAASGKPKDAIQRLSELITSIEESPYPMESSLGKLYVTRGILKRVFISSSSAKDDLEKARQYMNDSLPPEHPLLKQAQDLFNWGNLQISEKISK